MRSTAHIVVIVVASILAVGVVAAGSLVVSFDPNSLKPRIIEAVKRATGRDLALNGKIGLKASLWPTIEVQDVSFANPAGFSRPWMATLQSLELQLGLLPLLSSQIEIERLVLVRPDILLETDAAGIHNWDIAPEVSPSAPDGTAPSDNTSPGTPPGHPLAPDAKKRPAAISVQSIQILDGTLAFRDDRGGTTRSLSVARLTAKAASSDSPVLVQADAAYDGIAFSLAGDTGSLSRLQDRAASTPWPVNLALSAPGTRLGLEGALTNPLDGKGYVLSANGSVADLSVFAPLLPTQLPLRDIRFSAKVADSVSSSTAGLPTVSALALHVGSADLGFQISGLRLDRLDVSAPALDQGFKADAAGQFGDTPFSLSGAFGPTTALTSAASPQVVPFSVALQAAGVPIAAKATLTAAAAGFRNGLALRGLSLSSPVGDLAGDVALALQPRRSLIATLASNHIDLDAWRANAVPVVDKPAPQPASSPGVASPRPPRGDRIFSDQPIPFARLREADADLKLTIGTLHSREADAKAVRAHVVLNNGKLTVDPLTADLPQGPVDAKLLIDASQPAPAAHLLLRTAGLALKSVLTALRQPPFASGNLEVQADLSGAGTTPHALAASLDGSLGLAVAGGTIDNRLLGSILGRVMNEINALDLVGRGGATALRCFGARVDAHHGVADIRALALSSSLLTMTGGGTLDLADETMALTLRPEVRIVGTSVVVPISVSGPIQKPSTSVSKIGAAESNVGSIAGAVTGGATALGIVGGLLGADKVAGGGDVCPATLAAGRGQAAPAAAAPKPAPLLSNPSAELRKLFK